MGIGAERRSRLTRLRDEVEALRDEALAAESSAADQLSEVQPEHRAGAVNALHYRAVRAHDLRDLQPRLAAEGLSSLGRMESGVLANLTAVIRIIDDALAETESRAADEHEDGERTDQTHVDPDEGKDMLEGNAVALLGDQPKGRSARVMVTMPSAAATDAELVHDCASAGMNLARINCAHDGPDAWRAMAGHIRDADRDIRIAMDLAGPKLRTGPIEPGPKVVKIKPRRDALGRVTSPARFWFGDGPDRSEGAAGSPAEVVPVDDHDWPGALTKGDVITLTDARERTRTLTVDQATPHGVLVTCDRTVYLTPGIVLRTDSADAVVGDLPPVEQTLRVFRGDILTLTADMTPTAPTGDGEHRIGCSLPDIFDSVAVGDRVFFDDGKIEGTVSTVPDGEMTIEITRAKSNGTKLKGQKGINLPDTALAMTAITDEDVTALDTVVELADVVNLSFVQGPDDVAALQRLLEERDATDIGIVLKIETVTGFEALPEMLLQLMRTRRVGVMIARGDLAVETGFERLAEVQEEILWLCEAAHVPVVWATQVLDSLADRGLPTRAEVTDAAAGERAECVMLNKGPHIVDAIEALTEILSRMRGHVDKKRTLMRRLGAWQAER
ncbi:pyruvate kinase [Gordonia sp. PKS22-38]|uniref:pyruvate kinase n=1 Tax=Gordonia prachuapensis TaxID=3115651 RepID=A0ABU7MNC4_9ACTN|nr:pyruvate kinase [Gordonia sp. PKS22-38]